MKTTTINISEIKNLSIQGLKVESKKHYKTNVLGSKVKNEDTPFTVEFPNSGLNHVLYSRTGGREKYYALFKIKELVKNAVFLNFKNRDEDDTVDVLGYVHLKAKASIGGKIYYYRIVIRIFRNGKYYYDHSIRTKK